MAAKVLVACRGIVVFAGETLTAASGPGRTWSTVVPETPATTVVTLKSCATVVPQLEPVQLPSASIENDAAGVSSPRSLLSAANPSTRKSCMPPAVTDPPAGLSVRWSSGCGVLETEAAGPWPTAVTALTWYV